MSAARSPTSLAAELSDMADCMAPDDGAIPCLRQSSAILLSSIGRDALVRSALEKALAFTESEIENREHAGGEMTDYLAEAVEAGDSLQAALTLLGVK